MEEARRRNLDRVEAYVRSHPGTSVRGLAAALQCGTGSASRWSHDLQAQGRLHVKADGAARLLYVVGAVVKAPSPPKYLIGLAAVVNRMPGAAQKDILDAMEAKGWPRSTTQHRLGQLRRRSLGA